MNELRIGIRLYILSSPKYSTVEIVVAAAVVIVNQSHEIYIYIYNSYTYMSFGNFCATESSIRDCIALFCAGNFIDGKSMHAEYLSLILPLLCALGDIASLMHSRLLADVDAAIVAADNPYNGSLPETHNIMIVCFLDLAVGAHFYRCCRLSLRPY